MTSLVPGQRPPQVAMATMHLGGVEVDVGPGPGQFQGEGLFSRGQVRQIVQGVMDQNPIRIRDKALFHDLAIAVHHGKFRDRGLWTLAVPKEGIPVSKSFKIHRGGFARVFFGHCGTLPCLIIVPDRPPDARQVGPGAQTSGAGRLLKVYLKPSPLQNTRGQILPGFGHGLHFVFQFPGHQLFDGLFGGQAFIENFVRWPSLSASPLPDASPEGGRPGRF